ncbi:hypothetical protein CERSUDRAFT_118336 [Gelatoporia subvermispora B]|uniref:Pinin/SDK/MemA protein domain-containing protein n=1 Tax=Ceriporiopsis subvermispora (strain B) TaxID=914234 RepID=M2R1Y0_CERS8|nr:hypothetical protein CERSUDRAFT_118336 [Gelatoporia subvermispora B]
MSAATETRPRSPPPTSEADADAPMQEVLSNTTELPTGPAAMASANKKRPRLDMTLEPRERKRGKSMFGVLMGTLAKAKEEDRERNSSDAAKKRQLIEQRLQDKLRKETDSVRKAEEAKKDKTTANRKEEELQLKDSIYKLRRTRLPLLANFLLTSDHIPDIPPHDSPRSPSRDANGDSVSSPSTINKAALTALTPGRSHPPPLFYLPAVLTPAQESFLAKRKTEAAAAAAAEWEAFRAEREAGLEEITRLRSRVAEEEARLKEQKRGGEGEGGGGAEAGEAGGRAKKEEDTVMATEDKIPETSAPVTNGGAKEEGKQGEGMDVDDSAAAPSLGVAVAQDEKQDEKAKEVKKEESSSMQADDDDAVEY